ncbi:antibiotic biosynthesis monooxygenase [Amycolatopsis sp. TRM77291]|uniref:antibiotic biosynthesis monooxygenase n=1 Tax=Amycolatopsis sp. WAC 04197 TaxID=2203199 RepID=UPI0013158D43|nr:antibiotic biosynthesis monooxygenase [Amycolatopsis sp. WAC 04197]
MTTGSDGAGDKELAVFIILQIPGREEQHKLANAVQAQIDSWIRTCPGFLSSRLHLSNDGTRIVNHARWKDTDHYESKFLADPRKAGLDKAIAEHALAAPTAFRCSAFEPGS